MGKNISLFADYHSPENIISNYCGLMLKLLYQDNPSSFQNVINSLCQESAITIGPNFCQQSKKRESIPDITIEQESFEIFFETKRNDWFYDDQITRHVNGFPEDNRKKILFLLSNLEKTDTKDHLHEARKIAKNKKVIIETITFEDLYYALDSACDNTQIKSILTEFEEFLNRNGLLPNWKYRLDIVSCTKTANEVIGNKRYFCPDTGGAYSHKRANYLGVYQNKNVSHILNIDAVVSVEQGGKSSSTKWVRNDDKEKQNKYAQEAIDEISKYRANEINEKPMQVFFLSDPKKVSFIKDTPGGMYGSKLYFELPRNCKNIKDVADYINNKTWSELK